MPPASLLFLHPAFSPVLEHQQCGSEVVSLSTTTAGYGLDTVGVSFSTMCPFPPSAVWLWVCIPFHRQLCRHEGVSLSTVNGVELGVPVWTCRVYPTSPVWTCRVYLTSPVWTCRVYLTSPVWTCRVYLTSPVWTCRVYPTDISTESVTPSRPQCWHWQWINSHFRLPHCRWWKRIYPFK